MRVINFFLLQFFLKVMHWMDFDETPQFSWLFEAIWSETTFRSLFAVISRPPIVFESPEILSYSYQKLSEDVKMW